MSSSLQDCALPLTPASMSARTEAIVRKLGEAESAWQAIAEDVLAEPALLHPILCAALHSDQDARAGKPVTQLREALNSYVATLLEEMGPDLLRAWLLHPRQTDGALPPDAAMAARALGECARHLAIETDYAYPDEAYLSGLFVALQVAPPSTSTPAAPRSVFLPAGFPPALTDVLALSWPPTAELLGSAHPLVRLVACAHMLVREEWQQHQLILSELTGLPAETLASLRADTRYLAGLSNRPNDAQHMPEALPLAPPSPLQKWPEAMQQIRDMAVHGLLRSAFEGLDEAALGRRHQLGLALLGDGQTALVLFSDSASTLRAAPFSASAELCDFIAELGLKLDDPVSTVALAARSGRAAMWHPRASATNRHLTDWHIGQRIGTAGFVAQPIAASGCKAVVLYARDESGAGTNTADIATLSSGALATWLSSQRRRDERAAFEQALEQRHREHARRVAHEARNPLTVIRSYLETMQQRHPEAPGLGQELQLVNEEIDRLAALVGDMASGPHAAPESTTCHIGELLHDMQRIYAEPLFGRHDIQFDLRVASPLPALAMPASALKQVFLNLFRNASEALHPGGRFSVVVPGQLISNGRRCVEIRLIDNGPGLPPARLEAVFSAGDSTKGNDHQGLGLHLVNTTLGQWNGDILCRSQPGAGTSFQILVPIADSR